MRLWGQSFTREQIYRHVGIESQAFGIRTMEYRQGDESLVKTYEVDTGAGLCFSVGENKGLDIYRLSYRGINMGFMSKAGLHSPYNVEPASEAFRYSQGCGMLYTAGLANVGGACRDAKGIYFPHGSIKNSAATNITACGFWDDDDYQMMIRGELREAEFYGRCLTLNRTISTQAGSKSLVIEDVIENRAFEDDEVMLLYHFNAGFPLLAEGVQMFAPVQSIEAATPRAAEMIQDYAVASAPVPMEEEYVYMIKMKCDEQGISGSVLWNNDMELGLFIRFDTHVLNRFVEWKCMRAGDYAFGMLPANCYPFGREQAAKDNAWTVLKPFETMCACIEIGVLEGSDELRDFQAWIGSMQ